MTDPDTELARAQDFLWWLHINFGLVLNTEAFESSKKHIARALRSVRKEENEAAALLAEVQCRYHNPERCKMEIDPDNEWPYCCVGCGTAYAIRNRMKEKP